MENRESFLQAANFDTEGQNYLKSSGKWSKFIGIVYLVLAALMFVIAVLIFANLDFIASTLMDINGMSEKALEFMMGAGKWLFALMMGFSCFLFLLNGYFLVKFGSTTLTYFEINTEEMLSNSFDYLGKYLKLTVILSLLSTVFTIAAIVYYFVK